MSSPITFSGFNNIDFNTVLSAVMQQASAPLTLLQNQQSALESQVTVFGSLSSRVSTLASAVDALADLDSLNSKAATSSAPSLLSVSADSNAQAGHYDVVVTELARAQVTASTSTTADADTTVVATGGTLDIGGVTVEVTGSVTLSQLADAINDTEGIGVSATVIQSGTNAYRLVLSGTQTGTAGAFTITNGLSGGTGVVFGDDDGDGTSGDSAADNAVQATDAALLVNNIPVTGSSNTFEDVVPGVTLQALNKDASTTISVDVAPSGDAIGGDLDEFITAYNALVSFIDAQRTAAGKNDVTSIGRDPVVGQLRSTLRSALFAEHGSGTYTRLADIGLGVSASGTLELNRTRLAEAIETDGDAVRDLLAGTDGVFTGLATVLDEYTNSSGFIPSATKRLNDRIGRMNTQIDNLQSRLELQRQSMLQEFIAADTIMSRLKNQSGSLSGFGSGLAGF